MWGLRDTAFSGGLGRSLSLRCLCPLLCTRDFCGGWQLITANIKKESAVDVDHTVTRLLSPEFVRAGLPVILALQETRSWTVEEMHVPGFVVYENVSGLTTLIVSDRSCDVQRTWRSEERCAAVLFGFTWS